MEATNTQASVKVKKSDVKRGKNKKWELVKETLFRIS
jgi:hypothetical protein